VSNPSTAGALAPATASRAVEGRTSGEASEVSVRKWGHLRPGLQGPGFRSWGRREGRRRSTATSECPSAPASCATQLSGLQLPTDLAHQGSALSLARLAAQLGGPARIFDDCPGDRFIMERSSLIDMGGEDDPQGPLRRAGGVGIHHARPGAVRTRRRAR
jgi:hypothetical protein